MKDTNRGKLRKTDITISGLTKKNQTVKKGFPRKKVKLTKHNSLVQL